MLRKLEPLSRWEDVHAVSVDSSQFPLELRHEKTCFMPYANNKGADQPAHPRSLISAFVFRCLDSITPLVVIFEISRLQLACVSEQAGLSLTWSQTPKARLTCIHAYSGLWMCIFYWFIILCLFLHINYEQFTCSVFTFVQYIWCYSAVLYSTLISLTIFLAVKKCAFVTTQEVLSRSGSLSLLKICTTVIRQAENDLDAVLHFFRNTEYRIELFMTS